MTREEIIEMLIIERNCVERQDTPLCNRHCESCDLVMPTEKVVKAYELAIDLLHQEPCDDAISREAVIDFIDRERDFIKAKINKLPSVTPKSGKWIPVRERLPEVGISVLVSDADSDIYFTHITRDGVFFDEWGNKIKGIVAWTPLPKPYEPQESEDKE